ncbi:MAG: type I DNA topoisomerase [Candidatus Omnitrophica bacterium]|jgi:DNA topoisomerase-1|nr:type I DNA topoisomerase [Candidatus Omnitrophota bacterium]
MPKKNLVIVESPTKARTITKILGGDFEVVSTMGHVIDLPQKSLGVDIEKNFEAEYVVIPSRKKVLTDLKKQAKEKDCVYIATDPDREGEAIGFHIKERLGKVKKVMRVVFHEITSSAVKEAFSHAREFDKNMVEAQAGRRVLDRIVGYFLSPLLWKKITRGLSAGRVQSVALRIIVEREREIQKFVPQEYWDVEAELKKKDSGEVFIAKLDKADDKKVKIVNKEEADALVSDIKNQKFIVSDVEQKEKRRNPLPPFITSTLQQDSFNRLKFNGAKTMLIAQQLYEGVDIGHEEVVGLITYMRTDSPRVAPEAITAVRKFIQEKFGQQYLPQEPNIYKVKKHAQEAHEAIRPTLISKTPEELKDYLTPEQYKLYELIYRRFVSSQMNPAVYLTTSVDIQAGKYLFSASGSKITFDGFLAMYDKKDEDEDKEKQMPSFVKEEALDLLKLDPSQHFTKPPARFSDSSLVKALEEDGIGRPSTYAPIIQTLILRDYMRRIRGYFFPTELGMKVSDMLVEYFPKIMDLNFTALMEEELDEIEEGQFEKEKVLNDFYKPFKESLDFAQNNIKKEVVKTEETCEKCGKPMVIKWGRRGKFLSCCAYPECTFSKSITTKVKCPEKDCGGELIERHSRRGLFYGCSNFPKCRFVSKDLPGEEEESKE